MIVPLINHAWWAMAQPAARRFRAALADPRAEQERVLRRILRENADSAFGSSHHFPEIGSPEEFASRVPARTYDELAPWIDRVAAGDSKVLTREPVPRLMPSSGSTRARKLIPFTRSLGAQFNAAVCPWMDDIFRRCPARAHGCSYWSITPTVPVESSGPVPIGFDDDSAYLGGAFGALIARVMAVRPEIAAVSSVRAFRYATLLSLLRCANLSIVSVWHPSFLSLLLDELALCWSRLVADVAAGTCEAGELSDEERAMFRAKPDPVRARVLERVGPRAPHELWPSLSLVSCWGDAGAAAPMERLRARIKPVLLQPKGLLATEGVVSLPLGESHPLAVTSHFLEFLDADGRLAHAWELRGGEEYEVLLTTGGGLYRYRLGDRVVVTDFVDRTPSIRLIGRSDGVVDLVGEKLSETHVGAVVDAWKRATEIACEFAMLAPDPRDGVAAYTLFVDAAGPVRAGSSALLDTMLKNNPHYAYARDLGQLRPARLFFVSGDSFDQYSRALVARGMRLGDLKAVRLSRFDWWASVLSGRYGPTSG